MQHGDRSFIEHPSGVQASPADLQDPRATASELPVEVRLGSCGELTGIKVDSLSESARR